MADKKDVEKQKDSKQEKQEKTNEKASGGGILQWIIMAVVVVVFSGSGFVLARLFAGSGTPETAETSGQEQSAQEDELTADDDSTEGSQKTWYYDLEPVVANLDVPGATRYVRAALTLEVSASVEKNKGIAFFEKNNPLLKNWLTIYLASLTLEDIRGDRNLKRIQSQILDAFNEKLFPDAKPQIKKILFKEFAIQ